MVHHFFVNFTYKYFCTFFALIYTCIFLTFCTFMHPKAERSSSHFLGLLKQPVTEHDYQECGKCHARERNVYSFPNESWWVSSLHCSQNSEPPRNSHRFAGAFVLAHWPSVHDGEVSSCHRLSNNRLESTSFLAGKKRVPFDHLKQLSWGSWDVHGVCRMG